MRQAKRSFDRTLLTGIMASLTVHALLLGALCLLTRAGGAGSQPMRRLPGAATMDVQLVASASRDLPLHGDAALAATAPGPILPQARPSPAPVVQTAEASVGGVPDGAASAGGAAAGADRPASTTLDVIDPGAGDDYRRALLDHIMIYRRPSIVTVGEYRGGTVMVHFSVTRGGEVLALTIAASSGSGDLDDEAIATIWRARPMPGIPPTLPDRVSVTLPVTFSVGRAQAPG